MALAATAHAVKAARVVVVVAAVKAAAVVKADSPIRYAPALTPWVSAVATAAVVAVEVAAVVANRAVAAGVLTHCAPALAASNKQI